MAVGREDVTLKTGKSANKRQIQFALQALLALFDPQEAPRSIDIEEEETSSEDLDERMGTNDEILDQGSSPMTSARKHSFILDGPNRSSAFTSYRKRGEPDGRQSNQGSPTTPATNSVSSTSSSAVSTPLTAPNFRSSTWKPSSSYNQPPLALVHHPKGHESDCNFTPSPVEPHPRSLYGDRSSSSKMFNTLPSDQGSPIVSGSAIKNSNTHPNAGMFSSRYSHNLDDSSSSASSMYNDVTHSHHSHHPTLALRQPVAQMRRHTLLQQNHKSAQHLHPTVHQRINQAVSEIATDVANVSALRVMGNTVPLYENTDFTSKQPAGRPILPIRSVFTDVGYHSTLKLQDKSDPNDKFNVRTEIGKLDKRKPETTPTPPSMKSLDIGREDR